MLAHYEKYEFHPVVSKLATFCSEDLGGFYLDVLKDRLYTTKPDSRERRAAQTALYHIAHGLLRLIAPYLSFTAEEAYKVLQARPATRSSPRCITPIRKCRKPANCSTSGPCVRSARGDVTKALEEARTANAIGSSLQAEVEVRASGARYDALASLGADLKFVLITSAAALVKVDERSGRRRRSACVEVSEVRALLALLRGRRRECRASGALRPVPVSNLFGSGETRSAA